MDDPSTLGPKAAYRAMLAFLHARYARTASDELGQLLGAMALMPDGDTADPAIWAEWLDAIARSQAGADAPRSDPTPA